MTCSCSETVDEKLATVNTRLSRVINFKDGTARPYLVTEQVETGRGKKKAVVMAISFCPFCGVKYDEAAQ